MLKISHYNAGFFSNYTVILYYLINDFNENKSFPEKIDITNTFNFYKYNNNIDIFYDFFEHYDNMKIIIENKKITNSSNFFGFQYYNYKNINYHEIIPFIQKYFTPSKNIINIQNELLLKYNIVVDNCIALYYRGTDKKTETALDSFDSYYNKLKEVISNYENKDNKFQIIIQTDSANFLDFMKDKLVDENIIIIKENDVSYNDKGIHNEKNFAENYRDIHYLLPSVLIMSKCKYLLTSSNNVSIVMMFYRYLYKNNIENSHQNLNLEWL